MKIDIPIRYSHNLHRNGSKNLSLKILLFVSILLINTSCHKQSSPGSPIIAEISVSEIILRLSANPEDSLLNYFLHKSAEIKQKSNDDFYSIFEKLVLKEAPNQKLSVMFPVMVKSHLITELSGNDDVIRAIRSVSEDVYSTVKNTITARLLQSNIPFEWIKENLNKDRFMIMLKNQADSSRIRNLIESRGRLEFWETSTFKEIFPQIVEANAYIKSIDALKLLSLSPRLEHMRNYMKENLLNYFLRLNLYQGEDGIYYPASAAEIGKAYISDTANVNKLLSLSRSHFPRQLKFVWERWPSEILNSKNFNLIAVHSDLPGCTPYLEGSLLQETKIVRQGKLYWVKGRFNIAGQQGLKKLTSRNINRQIAILLDGKSMYAPYINEEISIEEVPLTQLLELKEAVDCSSILSCGELTVAVRIIHPAKVDR